MDSYNLCAINYESLGPAYRLEKTGDSYSELIYVRTPHSSPPPTPHTLRVMVFWSFNKGTKQNWRCKQRHLKWDIQHARLMHPSWHLALRELFRFCSLLLINDKSCDKSMDQTIITVLICCVPQWKFLGKIWYNKLEQSVDEYYHFKTIKINERKRFERFKGVWLEEL